MSSRLALLLLLGTFAAMGQPAMTAIYTNGAATNRVNIVILSEGYTTNQLGQFLADATNAANVLLGWEPYNEYRNFFNVFAIAVASTESGSDHPVAATYRDTYFNSSYDPYSDYIITIPPNDQDTNYDHGQGKVDALLQTFMPQCQLPVLLVNDVVWGGSDGFDRTAITYNGANLYQVLPHETGHVIGALGDEYDYAFTFPNTEEPNTTQETNRASIKWNAWISTNTPVPTPATGQYANDVGLFQGAHYHTTGWYRPKLDCTMRSFGVPFCEVCREAMVKAFYQRVRPIDTIIPASPNISLATTQSQVFSVSAQQPQTHRLTVQWFTNGIAVPGATNSNFLLMPQMLPNGSNYVSAVVRDATDRVKNDPANLLRQTVGWSVTVGTQFTLDSLILLPGGAFAFRVHGSATGSITVQGSTNLNDWISLGTNVLSGGEFWHTNSGAGTGMFFRAVTQP
jgi:hypothetical protein